MGPCKTGPCVPTSNRRARGYNDGTTLMSRSVDSENVVDDDADALSFSAWLKFFLATSTVGFVVEIGNVVLSISSCFLYVAMTYQSTLPAAALWIDVILSSCFALYFVLDMLRSKKPLHHVFQLSSIVDIGTIIPVFTLGTRTDPSFLIRFVRLWRVLRIFHVFFLLRFFQSEIKAQVFRIFAGILSLAFVSASVIEVVENYTPWLPPVDDLPFNRIDGFAFHDTFYFVIITLTTVGYGDFSPLTVVGKLAVGITIATAFLAIPRETNRLLTLLSKQSVYIRQRYQPSRNATHIIVCGALGSRGADASPRQAKGHGVLAFFREFFNEDHGSGERNAVVLAKGPPSKELGMLMSHGRYAIGITYLDGDIMHRHDLDRAAVDSAAGVFVLSNKFSKDVEAEDSSTILRALALKRYVFERTGRDVMTCVQLIRPENRALFHSTMVAYTNATNPSGGPSPTAAEDEQTRTGSRRDHHPKVPRRRESLASSGAGGSGLGIPSTAPSSALSVCVDEIKHNLLAKSCLCPGLTTLVYNLVASDMKEENHRHYRRSAWLEEYSAGCSYEIYRVPLSAAFQGCTFVHTARIVFEELGVPLFALEVYNPETASTRISINPGHFLLPNVVTFAVHGFVIAEDRQEADMVTTLGISRMRGSRRAARKGSVTGNSSVVPHTPHGGDFSRSPSRRRGPSFFDDDDANHSTGAAQEAGEYAQRTGRVDSMPSPSAQLYRDPGPSPVDPEADRRAVLARRIRDARRIGRQLVEWERLHVTACRKQQMEQRQRQRRGGEGTPLEGDQDGEREHEGKGDSEDDDPLSNTVPIGIPPEHANNPNLQLLRRLPGPMGHRIAFPKPSQSERDASSRPRNVQSLELPSRRDSLSHTSQKHPRPLSEMTIHSVTDARFDHNPIEGHVIVLGSGAFTDLRSFVKPLRETQSDDDPAIVFVNPFPPSATQWSQLPSPQKFYYLEGSPLKATDLLRAGVCEALAVVLFAPSAGNERTPANEDTLADSDAVCVYRLVRSLAPSMEVIVEITDEENIQFLASTAPEGGQALHSPPFLAGHVFSPSVLDILLCQAFFNPHIVTVLQLLVSGPDAETAQEWNQTMGPTLGPILDSQMYLVPVPPHLIGDEYRNAFDFLLAEAGALPLALRRVKRGSLAQPGQTETSSPRVDSRASSDPHKPGEVTDQGNSFRLSDMEGTAATVTVEGAVTQSLRRGFGPGALARVPEDENDDSAGRSGNTNAGVEHPSAASYTTASGQQEQFMYVVTRPPPETILRTGDQIFVLGRQGFPDHDPGVTPSMVRSGSVSRRRSSVTRLMNAEGSGSNDSLSQTLTRLLSQQDALLHSMEGLSERLLRLEQLTAHGDPAHAASDSSQQAGRHTTND